MESTESLFGHMAIRFGEHPENLATESILYVLKRCPGANASFREFVSRHLYALPDALDFRTQAHDEDGTIPDLVGADSKNKEVLFVEFKFWAGLTDKQPCQYISRIQRNGSGLLLFVAPSTRIPTLWTEIRSRCEEQGLSFASQAGMPDLFHSSVDDVTVIAITSWNLILEILLNGAMSSGDLVTSSDIRQLKGLCNRMDSDAFMPLRSEELSPEIGRRIYQYCEIVNDVTDQLLALNAISLKGLKAVGSMALYGRYMRLGKFGCFLYFSAWYWGSHVHVSHLETPLWLRVRDIDPETGKWCSPVRATERLSFFVSRTQEMIKDDSDGLLIGLRIKTGVEKQIVVKDLVGQILHIGNLLNSGVYEDTPEPIVQSPDEIDNLK